jgi:hypothetical protein
MLWRTGQSLALRVVVLRCKFLKGHDLKSPVFGVLCGLVTNAAVALLPSDCGIESLGMNPNVGPRSARTKVLSIQSAASKLDPLVAVRTLNEGGYPKVAGIYSICESVECCSVFPCGDLN